LPLQPLTLLLLPLPPLPTLLLLLPQLLRLLRLLPPLLPLLSNSWQGKRTSLRAGFFCFKKGRSTVSAARKGITSLFTNKKAGLRRLFY
jgi:hypothetical protein